MNDFRLVQHRWEDEGGAVLGDIEVVIDGVELSDLLEARPDDGSSWLPMPYSVVAPPSRHWLGSPAPGYARGRLVAVLDGGCGVWECCGPGAEMTFETDRVVWDIPGLERFEFDRRQYESEIAGLS